MSVVTIIGWIFAGAAFIAALVERRRVRRLRLDQVGRPERLLRAAARPPEVTAALKRLVANIGPGGLERMACLFETDADGLGRMLVAKCEHVTEACEVYEREQRRRPTPTAIPGPGTPRSR